MNKTDRATEARKILLEGIEKAKLEVALRLYRDGHSIGHSAQNAHVTIWDLIDYLTHTGQTAPIDYESLKKEYLDQLEL